MDWREAIFGNYGGRECLGEYNDLTKSIVEHEVVFK